MDKSVIDSDTKAVTDAKKDLEDTKRSQQLDEEKKAIEVQKTAENDLYKEQEKLLKQHEDDLKASQEREKARLETYYSDIETMSKTTLDELAIQYNNNWNAIADSIETRLAKTQQYLTNLNTLKNNFSDEEVQKVINSGTDLNSFLSQNKDNLNKSSGNSLKELSTELNNIKTSQADIKNNKVETDDIISYTSDSKNSISKVVESDLNSLKQQVIALQDANKEIQDEYDTHYKKLFDKQTTAQNNQYESLKKFADVYTKFTDKFLELVQIVYDYRFTNIVSIGKTSTDMIIQALVVCEEAFEKIVDIWNLTHKEEEWIKNIDIKSVVADMDKFKESVLGYTNSKAGYYDDKNNPLYNEALRSNYIDTAKYANQSAYTLGNSNLLTSANAVTNNNSKTSNITNVTVKDVTVNPTNVSEFISNMIGIAEQVTNLN